MARTFEFVLHFVKCDMVTLSPNHIFIIIFIRRCETDRGEEVWLRYGGRWYNKYPVGV